MQTRYPASVIDDETVKNELLKLDTKDITRELLFSYFSWKKDKKPRFMTYDKMTIPIGAWNNNKEPIKTTIGRFIFNTFILKPHFYTLVDYVNVPLTGGYFTDVFEKTLSKLLLADKITTEQFGDYLSKVQWLGFSFGPIICAFTDMQTIKPLKKVVKRREELLKQYSEELKGPDNAIVMGRIEKELLALAKEELKDAPSMDVYNCDGSSSFGNNYKNMSVIRGAVRSFSKNKFEVCDKNYVEGLASGDLVESGDSAMYGAFSRAINTQMGGYITKQNYAAFQGVTLDKPGSDCGTTLTISLKITKENKQYLPYRYIVEQGKLVLVTPDNIDSYVGKTVKLRSPMFCKGRKICSKCTGELYAKLGITNAGLLSTVQSSFILNKLLKLAHDQTIKIYEMNVEDYIGNIKEIEDTSIQTN